MRGTIPPEVGELSSLRRLELSGHLGHLGGTISPELGRLSNLEHLNLSHNHLTGAIPAELGRLATLTEMSLAENLLTGPIPPELGQLVNLEYLNLAGNPLSDELPGEFAQITGLSAVHAPRRVRTLGSAVRLVVARGHDQNLVRLCPTLWPRAVQHPCPRTCRPRDVVPGDRWGTGATTPDGSAPNLSSNGSGSRAQTLPIPSVHTRTASSGCWTSPATH